MHAQSAVYEWLACCLAIGQNPQPHGDELQSGHVGSAMWCIFSVLVSVLCFVLLHGELSMYFGKKG